MVHGQEVAVDVVAVVGEDRGEQREPWDDVQRLISIRNSAPGGPGPRLAARLGAHRLEGGSGVVSGEKPVHRSTMISGGSWAAVAGGAEATAPGRRPGARVSTWPVAGNPDKDTANNKTRACRIRWIPPINPRGEATTSGVEISLLGSGRAVGTNGAATNAAPTSR